MKKQLLVVLFCAFSFFSHSQLVLDWAIGIGGTSSESSYSVATDLDGNIYMAGYFVGTVDFNPAVAVAELESEGTADIFFAKYDADGNYLFAKSIGGSSGDYAFDIAVDNEGSIYITGRFSGTVDFNPANAGVANLTSEGSTDVFFAKYNSNGNYAFAKAVGGSGPDSGVSIAVDNSNNIYITGYFSETADFNPDEAWNNNVSSAGGTDVFLAKYDEYGNYEYAHNIVEGPGDDRPTSIAVDANNFAYVTGHFSGTADFAPLASEILLESNGSEDVFVGKYNALGFNLFAKRIGGAGLDEGSDILVDSEGAVYVAGNYSGSVDFAGNGNSVPSVGSTDIFYCKYDSDGDFDYVKALGGTGADKVNSMMIDGEGTVFLSGTFSGAVDFDPITLPNQVDIYTSAGETDIFLAKYSSEVGWYLGGYHMGGVNEDEALGMAADAEGNIIITGTFKGDADFGIEGASEILNNSSTTLTDIFLAKYAFDFISVNESDAEVNQAMIYPNPTSGDFTLMLDASHDCTQANVLDISGRMIRSHSLFKSQLNKRIDVADLPSGVYCIQLIGSRAQNTLKLIKE